MPISLGKLNVDPASGVKPRLAKIALIFLENSALEKFQNSRNWEAEVDGSVAVIDYGAGEEINTINVTELINNFVILHWKS